MSNNKMRIKKGDTVEIISGKDKGVKSSVMRAIPSSRQVIVEKVAMVKKSQRPSRDNPSGGFLNIERPIHVSTVMLVCPKCNKATRVNVITKDREKIRICKKCGKEID